jgi:hypothetical protein
MLSRTPATSVFTSDLRHALTGHGRCVESPPPAVPATTAQVENQWGRRTWSAWHAPCTARGFMRTELVCLALPALVATACATDDPALSLAVTMDPTCGEVIGDLVIAEAGCAVDIELTVTGISDRDEWQLFGQLPDQASAATLDIPARGPIALSWIPEPLDSWRGSAGVIRFDVVAAGAELRDPEETADIARLSTRVIDPAGAPAAYIRDVWWTVVGSMGEPPNDLRCGDTLAVNCALGGDLDAVGPVAAVVFDVDLLGADHLADLTLGADPAIGNHWTRTWSPGCGHDPGGLGGDDLVFHAYLFDRSGLLLDDMRSVEINGPTQW